MTSTKAKLIQIFGVDNVRSCAKQEAEKKSVDTIHQWCIIKENK